METVEFYQADDGWRWRLRDDNHEIIATGEAHTRERDAVRAFLNVAHAAGNAATNYIEHGVEHSEDGED